MCQMVTCTRLNPEFIYFIDPIHELYNCVSAEVYIIVCPTV